MFKDVFELKKNAWHIRLMNWIWGFDHTDFQFLCNYFWLSLFNVLFIVPILVCKGFYHGVRVFVIAIATAFNNYERWLDKQTENWARENAQRFKENVNNLSMDELAAIVERKSKRYRELYYRMSYEDFQALKSRFNTLYDEKEAKRAQARERRVKINMSAKAAKNTVRATIYLTIATVAYFCIRGIIWVIVHANWTKVWQNILVALIIIGGLVVAVLLIIGFILLIRRIFDGVELSVPPWLGALGRGVTWPFVWFGRGIVVLWAALVALKENNCPGINWKD